MVRVSDPRGQSHHRRVIDARDAAMNERRADQSTCAAFWVKGIAETLEAAELTARLPAPMPA